MRLDVDTTSLDVRARKAAGWIADKNAQVPANEMLSPPALTGANPAAPATARGALCFRSSRAAVSPRPRSATATLR